MKRFLFIIACLLLVSCASTSAPDLTGKTARPLASQVYEGSAGHGVELFFFVFMYEGKKIIVGKLADGTVVIIDRNPSDPGSELLIDSAFCPVEKKFPEGAKASGKFILFSQCPRRIVA